MLLLLLLFTRLTAIKPLFQNHFVKTVRLGGRFHTPLDNTIKLPYLRTKSGTETKGSKKIPYFRTENLKSHTLFRGTYLQSPYMGVPPRPPTRAIKTLGIKTVCSIISAAR